VTTVRLSVNRNNSMIHSACHSGADIRLPEALDEVRKSVARTR
jgi:hypothetical protein